MRTTCIWTSALLRTAVHSRRQIVGRNDRGEGVISTAIAVLIMAFLGAAMWVGFQAMWQSTSQTTSHKVEQIGNG
ncbi:MAG: hypothetical protein WCK41_03140 [Actinomycetes bacterium]